MSAPVPANEGERLAELMDYRILDTPAEGEFDGYARMVARLCGTRIGAITLLDRDRLWVKAVHGPLARESPRDHSFCPFTILQNEVLEVPDALLDARFAHSPLVVGEPHIRFYAGTPLVTRSGAALGTLCVFDLQPAKLSTSQRRLMIIAAAHISTQLELRRAILQLIEQRQMTSDCRLALTDSNRRQQDLTAMVVHDFKSPLTVLELNASVLVDDPALTETQKEVAHEIVDASRELAGMVGDLLDVSRSEDGHLIVHRSLNVDLTKLALEAIERLRPIAAGRNLRLELVKQTAVAMVDGDPRVLSRVLSNLIDNANKYAPQGSCIQVQVSAEAESVVLRVIDEGKGIPLDQRERVFEKYFQLTESTALRPSHGLGLAFCRLAVQAHQGTIEVEDRATGCAFRVSLPASQQQSLPC